MHDVLRHTQRTFDRVLEGVTTAGLWQIEAEIVEKKDATSTSVGVLKRAFYVVAAGNRGIPEPVTGYFQVRALCSRTNSCGLGACTGVLNLPTDIEEMSQI